MSRRDIRGAGVQRRSRRERAKPRGANALALFALFGAAPIAVAIYFFTLPKERQQQILDKVPEGAGGRALVAGGMVVALIVLARLALPAFHGACGALRTAMHWIQARGPVVRVLLFPVELVLWLLWFAFQMLYGLDMLAIIACALGALLATVRIFYPTFLEHLVPQWSNLVGMLCP